MTAWLAGIIQRIFPRESRNSTALQEMRRLADECRASLSEWQRIQADVEALEENAARRETWEARCTELYQAATWYHSRAIHAGGADVALACQERLDAALDAIREAGGV